MPKFNDKEKELIQEKLFNEGNRLFSLHGLKKVTVDDLVKAAGIAKGSFYAFYTNKEHLYMEILGAAQKHIWNGLQQFLEDNKDLVPRELTKNAFLWSFSKMQDYPVLMQTDEETTAYLFRKLPQDIIDNHTKDDEQEIIKLQEYGVVFSYDITTTAKALQVLAMTILSYLRKKDIGNETLIHIFVNGIVNEIVSDEK